MAWSSDFLLNKLEQVTHNLCIELIRIATGIHASKKSDINTININLGIKELVIGFMY